MSVGTGAANCSALDLYSLKGSNRRLGICGGRSEREDLFASVYSRVRETGIAGLAREEIKTTMNLFEYKITTHPAEAFREMVYFCSQEGNCSLERVPLDQIAKIESLLNERGQKGWELLQVAFGRDGILAFWKRIVAGEQIDTMR